MVQRAVTSFLPFRSALSRLRQLANTKRAGEETSQMLSVGGNEAKKEGNALCYICKELLGIDQVRRERERDLQKIREREN